MLHPPSESPRPPRKPRAARTSRKRALPPDVVKGRLKAHDPFELIRWVAFSQTDPRKALAELVQNSLDAEAARIHIIRFRHRGAPCLRIFDNGRGVIPELSRSDALRYIATHIGHSRKRSLSPQERLALMTQGQYGIGLLGFWCLGQSLEMRTAVQGQAPHRLILHRDSPDYTIEPMRGRLPLGDCWTEMIVTNLHPEASRMLLAGRMAEFLAAELRGQLLAREVDLLVDDAMARGRARKTLKVRPRRFLGEQLAGLGPLEVPGHPPIRLEVYYTGSANGSEDSPPLAVYCAGTLVAESFDDLAALGLDQPPWTDRRLTGFVDFPGFRVAPGTRRGVVPDEAAEAFVRALAQVRPALARILEGYERRRTEELDRTLVRDLQRAFRDFYKQRPSYALLPVGAEGDRAAGPADPAGAPGSAGSSAPAGAGADGSEEGEAGEPESQDMAPAAGDQAAIDGGPQRPESSDAGLEELPADSPPPATHYLLPPGPLSIVRIVPSIVRAECGAKRTIRAHALDATGRPVEGLVTFTWTLSGAVGGFADVAGTARETRIQANSGATDAAILQAAPVPAEGMLRVHARTGGGEARDAAREAESAAPAREAESGAVAREAESAAPARETEALPPDGPEAEAEARVEVLDELPGRRAAEGIPEPELVDLPAETWRSRMANGRWQVNAGHRDYRAIAEQPRLKLRYLALLFAKEIVLRNHQDPRLERPLEQVVEVACYADQRITARSGRAARGDSAAK